MSGILCVMAGGASGLAAVIPADSYTRTEASPTDSTCTISFNLAGSWSVTDDLVSSGDWKTGSGSGSDYWVRWTNTSGTLSSGTAGSWLSLASNRSFGVTYTGVSGNKSCTGAVEIATDSGGANVIASGSVTITALVEV